MKSTPEVEVTQALKETLASLKRMSYDKPITAAVDRAITLADRLQPTPSRMEVKVDLPGGQSMTITGEHSPLIAGLILEQVESAKHEKERVAIWGPITGAANMTILARMFPMLSQAPGIDPWEPRQLDKWAKTAWDEAGQHAARFCLMVWNSRAKWKSGKFDLHTAWAKWDANHRNAAMVWLTYPFYP